ncbi:MAG: FG-GAP-like repeat-containing protein [Isosphaeraceae bacterium]
MKSRKVVRNRAAAAVLLLAAAASAAALSRRTVRGPDAGPPRAAGPQEVVPGQRTIPLFSDDWFDDSGFSFTAAFSAPVTDPYALGQVRSGLEGRSLRGINQLQTQLDRLSPGDPQARLHSTRLNLMIGSLLMFEGRFEEAAARYRQVIVDEPTGDPMLRANLEMLVGIAALRRGETENCVACRNEASCIFPLAPEAVHQKTGGSREAIARFTSYLQKRPDDVGVRWLLNVAYMTLGEYPEKVPADQFIPLEPFRSKTDIGRFVNVSARVGLDTRGPNMAGGCVVDDFDGDGRLDVFLSTSDPTQGAALFVNRGDGTFEDRSESAGLAGQFASLNAKQADFDNDGRLDLFLMRGAWELPRRPTLLRNRGGGLFEDVTVAAGVAGPVATQGAAWGDYDNDGWVDLYVPGEYDTERPDIRNRDRLYHNNRDGTFTDVADRAGVRNERFGKGSDWGDFDDDGDLDLYVSNLGQPNRLYRNNGDGTFTDVAAELKVSEPIHSFACWFWDYDNDGRLDLFVAPYAGTLSQIVKSYLNMPTDGERPRLFHNEGPGKPFRDVTVAAGLDRVLIPMGSNFGDVDNDGYLDMYLGTGRPPYMYLVPNVLYRNVGGTRFEDVTTSTGTGHLQKGHGVAMADWDQDGDVDMVLDAGGATPGDRATNLLFQNPGHGRHWLNVKLVGVKSNRSALGARVNLEVEEPDGRVSRRHRMISSGGSFGGNPLSTTIGLGNASKIRTLKVVWPASKTEQVFENVPPDQAVEITEGRDAIRALGWKPIRLADASEEGTKP